MEELIRGWQVPVNVFVKLATLETTVETKFPVQWVLMEMSVKMEVKHKDLILIVIVFANALLTTQVQTVK